MDRPQSIQSEDARSTGTPGRAANSRHALGWLYVVLLIIAIGAAAVFWLRGNVYKYWIVSHAIHATGQLVDQYHVHREQHGTWPEPGSVFAKEVMFLRFDEYDGRRVDIFAFGGGRYVFLELHEDWILVQSIYQSDGPP